MSNEVRVPAVDCTDMAEFQRVISKLRATEDKVVLRLNCALPTDSFNKDTAKICGQFEQELSELRRQRYNIMYNCLRENQQMVNLNRDKSAEDGNKARSLLQNAMMNLRFIRNEQAVEEIIVDQTDKAVHERCRKAMTR